MFVAVSIVGTHLMGHIDIFRVVDFRHVRVEVRNIVPELLVDDRSIERPEEWVAIDKLLSTNYRVEIAFKFAAG